MPDPLSVTASIAGILTTTVQGVALLCNTIDNIRNAPESMDKTRLELAHLTPSLIKLESAVKENRPRLILSDEIQGALTSCHEACIEFNASLLHWTRNSSDGKRSFLDNFKIGVFRQARIETLRQQLNGGIEVLSLILDTANLSVLTVSRQPLMTKELGDQMLQGFETILTRKFAEAQEERKAIIKYVGKTLQSDETEEKEAFLRETARQRTVVDALERASQEALKKVVFERTGQKIHNVKATASSVTLTGFVNAEKKETMIEQDILNVAASKYSIAVAGVVNNVDIASLYSQMRKVDE